MAAAAAVVAASGANAELVPGAPPATNFSIKGPDDDEGSSHVKRRRRECNSPELGTPGSTGSSSFRRWRRGHTSDRDLGEVGHAIGVRRGKIGRTLSGTRIVGEAGAGKSGRIFPLAPNAINSPAGADSVHKQVAARRRTKPWFIIDPRKSRTMSAWDGVTTVCLLFTALVTPFEVAILDPPLTWAAAASDALFLLNRIIDVIFFTDMLLQFVLMIQTFDDREGVKWIDDPRTIVRSYLRSWFALDFVSLVPSAFDLVPLFLADGDEKSKWNDCGAHRCLNPNPDTSFISRFKGFRVIRVCRLIKLLRLIRASRMLRRWETRMSINYARLALIRVVLFYLIAAHWAACTLLLPTTFTESPMQTWLGYYESGAEPRHTMRSNPGGHSVLSAPLMRLHVCATVTA